MDGDKGEREEKAKESKTPSTPSTAVPISKGSGLKNPLREAGKQEEERETEGRVAEQKEEEQEEGLISEHLYKERKPAGTLGSLSPEGVRKKIQRKEERNQRLRREIQDTTNKTPKIRDPPSQGNNTPKKSPQEGDLNITLNQTCNLSQTLHG